MHFLLILLISNPVNLLPSQLSLYQPEDLVRILNGENFFKEVSNSKLGWIINFYVHYCGHCRRFSHIYKQFAKENSNKPINIGAINCAVNTEICYKLEIHIFPTIKTLNANKHVSDSEFKDFKLFDQNRTVSNLRRVSNDVIYNSAQDYSVLTPVIFTKDVLQDFYSHSVGDRVMFIIVDPDSKYDLARNLVLDTLHCPRFYLSNETNVQDPDLSSITTGNKFGVFATRYKGDVIHLSKNDPSNISELRKDIYRNFAYICPDLAGLFIISTNTELSGSNPHHNVNISSVTLSEIYIEDLIGAVSFSLRHEIAARDLVESDVKALRAWMHVIEQCIPWPKTQLAFIKVMLKFSNNHISINRSNLLAFLNTPTARAAFAEEPKWKSCQGSKEYFRGFPCSMWLLMHTMTVNCEKRTNQNVDSVSVLLAAKNYIDHFFSCSYCRTHFLDMASNVEEVVKTPKDAIKWLWKSHNKVNARLRFDDSADPENPKIQFPSREVCEACYNTKNVKNHDLFVTKAGFGVKEIQWNWPEVYSFLTGVYSAANIRVKEADSVAKHEDVNVGDEYAQFYDVGMLRK